jgi:hypothetical protein
VKIDLDKIKDAFPCKAWAYAEGLDSVKIGKWNGNEKKLKFTESLAEEYLVELRIFDGKRELKFTGDKCRDTANYDGSDFIPELADVQYFMYGEKAEQQKGYTVLREDRGGAIIFPAELDFPSIHNFPEGFIGLKLGVKNYVRYNRIPVLPKGEDFDFGLGTSGARAIEVVDYAYTGFFYADGKAVKL